MANEKISEALSDLFNKLPNSLNGNGQNFIFLLKKSLGTIADELNEKFEYISKIANAVTDTPDTTNEQIKNCKVQEVRVGTAISLILTWDYSDIKNYESCEIYIKEKKSDGNEVINWDDVAVSREIRTTKTNTYTVDGINAGCTYQIRFQGKNNLGTVSEASGNPVLIYSVNALNNVPDPPTDFSVYFNRDGVLWTWRQSKNLDYIYSELRTDTNVGNTVGLLEVTQDTKSTKMPPVREGTAYLYNKGYGSKYSTPVTVNWSKPVPAAPQNLTVTTEFQGLLISYSEIPEDCIGICISINGEKHYTSDDSFHYYCVMGDFIIKAAYYDCFGEGIWTNEQTASVVTEVDPDWLKAESISLDKVDKTIQTAVKDAQDSVEGISSAKSSISNIIAELGKSPSDSSYKSISELNKNLSSTKSDLNNVSNDLATKSTELSGEITGVKTNLSGLTSTVNNNSGNITELQQRADTIETTVANNNKNLSSQISQNASSISSIVANLNSTDITNSPYKTITTLKQTTDSISSTVSANKESADTAISQVSQKADDIKATIESNLNSTNTSTNAYKSIVQLQANINGVSSIVANNKAEQGKINNSYLSQINQNAEGITSVTARVDATEENITQIKQTESSIQTTVADNKKAQDTQNESFTSQITQNANSITSVVTDLSNTNKDLASTKEKVDSNYTAIVQNQNDIAMRVKTGELIQQINLSKEGILIDGNKVHITGETVFDDGVIVGKYIGDHEVVGTKIKEGTITTENIAANAITSGLIATNAVTADKIEADAVTADKIATGAVTADSIGANAVTADKLTSGAVTADKLAANTINLAGALKIVGGNVTLDETGLSVNSTDGKTLFNGTGMIFTDSTGVSYNIVTRSIMGTAKNGQYVKFGSKWPTVPNVIVSPLSMVISNTAFSTSTVTLHSYADQITQEGFYVRCYSGIKNGQGVASYNRNYYSGSVSIYKPYHKGGRITVTSNSVGSTSFTAPTNGSQMTIRYRINVSSPEFDGTFSPSIKTNIYVNGSLASSATDSPEKIVAGGAHQTGGGDAGYSYTNAYGAPSISTEFTQTIGFTSSATIKIESTYVSGDYGMPWSSYDNTVDMPVNMSCDLISTSFNVTGEQVLDANGTALFLVTDNVSRNYTVS